DRSITNRLEIWKQAPRMMVDAPGGWGIGNSGNAYGQWYQPLDQHELYRTLVNTHLTWLVEVVWPLRFLYVFGLFTAVVFCWKWHGRKRFSIPLGIWIAFGVAATFSLVAESPWLWILPGLNSIAVLSVRTRRRLCPSTT